MVAPKKSPAAKKTKKNQKTRAELDIEAKERKKLKKRKGLASGQRANAGMTKNKNSNETKAKDPRIGSKKTIALVVGSDAQVKEKAELNPKKPMSPQRELEKLESNRRLDFYLGKLESGEILHEEEQEFVDTCLDRIDELMNILGIVIEDDKEENDDEEKKEDIMQLLRG